MHVLLLAGALLFVVAGTALVNIPRMYREGAVILVVGLILTVLAVDYHREDVLREAQRAQAARQEQAGVWYASFLAGTEAREDAEIVQAVEPERVVIWREPGRSVEDIRQEMWRDLLAIQEVGAHEENVLLIPQTKWEPLADGGLSVWAHFPTTGLAMRLLVFPDGTRWIRFH